jgi:hypothetical protein
MAASVPVEDSSSGSVRPRKAESLNADLVKTGKYTVSEQKQETAWLDLRNKAAHGKYSEYVKQQVGLMLDGVRDFIFRIRQWVTGLDKVPIPKLPVSRQIRI